MKQSSAIYFNALTRDHALKPDRYIYRDSSDKCTFPVSVTAESAKQTRDSSTSLQKKRHCGVMWHCPKPHDFPTSHCLTKARNLMASVTFLAGTATHHVGSPSSSHSSLPFSVSPLHTFFVTVRTEEKLKLKIILNFTCDVF
jgi:hypothetical protein